MAPAEGRDDAARTWLRAEAHRRYDPLLDEWVLCSPARLERPWRGQVEPPPAVATAAHDPACPLCPGNVRANGKRNPRYDGPWAFDNDFPALGDGRMPDVEDEAPHPLLRAEPVRGICRVLSYGPRHDHHPAAMAAAELSAVVDLWCAESARAETRGTFRHVQLFENRGAAMGTSEPHPHAQLWATSHLPTRAARRLATQRAHLARTGSDLLGDYLTTELERGERVVIESAAWVLLVPFWATWPFETLLVPRERFTTLPSLSPAARGDLVVMLSRLYRMYDALFEAPLPWTMAWHPAPVDRDSHDEWRLHATWMPPMVRSATVRKFQVGYELAAEAQRDLTPESAAARLREAAAR